MVNESKTSVIQRGDGVMDSDTPQKERHVIVAEFQQRLPHHHHQHHANNSAHVTPEEQADLHPYIQEQEPAATAACAGGTMSGTQTPTSRPIGSSSRSPPPTSFHKHYHQPNPLQPFRMQSTVRHPYSNHQPWSGEDSGSRHQSFSPIQLRSQTEVKEMSVEELHRYIAVLHAFIHEFHPPPRGVTSAQTSFRQASRQQSENPGHLPLVMLTEDDGESRATDTAASPFIGADSDPVITSPSSSSAPLAMPSQPSFDVTFNTLDKSLLMDFATNVNAMSVASNIFYAPAATTGILNRTVDDDGSKLINDYVVLQELGRGAFGKVKLAYDPIVCRMVAIKIVKKPNTKQNALKGGNQQDQSLTLQREIAVMKKLRHKNIVNLYEVIDDPDANKLCLVMRYVDNGPIGKVDEDCLSCTQYTPEDLHPLALNVVNGLYYLHARNIVHRDIKPENILVSSDGEAFLADFGVSEMFEREEKSQVEGKRGTKLFMAPELLNSTNKSVKGRALDIWALGVTLFGLLMGKMPFLTMEEITDNSKPDFSILPMAWVPLIKGMLNRDPEQRLGIHRVRHILKRMADGGPDEELTFCLVQDLGTGDSQGSTTENQPLPEVNVVVNDADLKQAMVPRTDVGMGNSGLRKSFMGPRLSALPSPSTMPHQQPGHHTLTRLHLQHQSNYNSSLLDAGGLGVGRQSRHHSIASNNSGAVSNIQLSLAPPRAGSVGTTNLAGGGTAVSPATLMLTERGKADTSATEDFFAATFIATVTCTDMKDSSSEHAMKNMSSNTHVPLFLPDVTINDEHGARTDSLNSARRPSNYSSSNAPHLNSATASPLSSFCVSHPSTAATASVGGGGGPLSSMALPTPKEQYQFPPNSDSSPSLATTVHTATPTVTTAPTSTEQDGNPLSQQQQQEDRLKPQQLNDFLLLSRDTVPPPTTPHQHISGATSTNSRSGSQEQDFNNSDRSRQLTQAETVAFYARSSMVSLEQSSSSYVQQRRMISLHDLAAGTAATEGCTADGQPGKVRIATAAAAYATATRRTSQSRDLFDLPEGSFVVMVKETKDEPDAADVPNPQSTMFQPSEVTKEEKRDVLGRDKEEQGDSIAAPSSLVRAKSPQPPSPGSKDISSSNVRIAMGLSSLSPTAPLSTRQTSPTTSAKERSPKTAPVALRNGTSPSGSLVPRKPQTAVGMDQTPRCKS